MMDRKPLSKKIRFEVFKRDKFTCQYCGRMAPDVILEIDHIKPVAEGGDDELINLLTSCRDCNRGKGKTRLSDSAELKKQQVALEELAEKREQTELMMKWRIELAEFMKYQVDYVCDYVESITSSNFNEFGRERIKKLIHQFSMPEVIDACDIAYSYYYDGSDESWEKAANKLGGICYNRRKQRDGNL